jgi:hypothetical protein
VTSTDAVEESALIDSMYAYRIQRPETRVIVFAPGRKPCSTVLAQLVAMGV